MPIIAIQHASPINEEQATKLIHGLTETYASVTGTNPNALHVLLQQVEPTHWGVGGTSLAAKRAQ